MMKLNSFEAQILFFNGMYKLPVSSYPRLPPEYSPIERLKNFKKILHEEIDEMDAIIAYLEQPEPTELEVLTLLADLLGDIQVYCASEMAKFGIPIKETTDIIMASNFSKLGADGNPIYDVRGKVMKGPNYWKPEPEIKEMLLAKIVEHDEHRTNIIINNINKKE